MFSDDERLERLARSVAGDTIEYLWREGFLRDDVCDWGKAADDVRLVEGGLPSQCCEMCDELDCDGGCPLKPYRKQGSDYR